MKGSTIKGYGIVALKAIETLKKQPNIKVDKAWDLAISQLNISSKACPKSTFIVLCANAYVRGISNGNYDNRIQENKNHVIRIMTNIDFPNTEFSNYSNIWRRFISNKPHNSQIDVIHALYEHDLLEI
jgi:hypothetical protein